MVTRLLWSLEGPLGLRLGLVPALAYGSCKATDKKSTARYASDLRDARAASFIPSFEARRDIIS